MDYVAVLCDARRERDPRRYLVRQGIDRVKYITAVGLFNVSSGLPLRGYRFQ